MRNSELSEAFLDISKNTAHMTDEEFDMYMEKFTGDEIATAMMDAVRIMKEELLD